MVSVVVHQKRGSAIGQLDVAVFLEAAADAFKTEQAALNRFNGCADFQRHADGGQGIKDIVSAGHVQHDFKRRLLMSFHLNMNGKLHLRADAFDVGRVNIGGIVQAVSGVGLAHFG